MARRSSRDRRMDARHRRKRDGVRAARTSHAIVLPGRRLPHRAAKNRALRRAEPALRAAGRPRIALVGARRDALRAPVLSARALRAARGARARSRAARAEARRSHVFRGCARRRAMPLARARALGRRRWPAARERNRARGAEPPAARAEHDGRRRAVQGRPRARRAPARARLHRHVPRAADDARRARADRVAVRIPFLEDVQRIVRPRAARVDRRAAPRPRARTLLRTTSLPLAQVAAQCGYANAVHLSHRFRDTHGATPGAYRRAMQAA